MDTDKVIRVVGRLRNSNFESNINSDKKHSDLLSLNHHITKLLFESEHVLLLHTGPHWVICGSNIAPYTIRKCVECFKFNGKVSNIIMKIAGPFYIKNHYERGPKVYICLFVCFSTKAMHSELVSNLSSSAFIQAPPKFIFRRGKQLTMVLCRC